MSSYIISSSLQKAQQCDTKHMFRAPSPRLRDCLIVLQNPAVLMLLCADDATHRDIDWLLFCFSYFLFFCKALKSRLLAWQSQFRNAQWSIDRPPLPHPDLCSRTRSLSSPHWFTGRAVVTRPQHPLREGGGMPAPCCTGPLRQARPPQIAAGMTVWEFFNLAGAIFRCWADGEHRVPAGQQCTPSQKVFALAILLAFWGGEGGKYNIITCLSDCLNWLEFISVLLKLISSNPKLESKRPDFFWCRLPVKKIASCC